MLRAPAAAAIGSMLCLAASTSLAMGFGRVDSATVLGQPLEFSAVLNLDSDEALAPECVGAEVTVGENKLAQAQVQVHLDRSAGAGQATLTVLTSVRIDEPVVTVQLMLGCPVRLSRQFVAFIDPPLLGIPPTTVAEAAPARTSTPSTSAADQAAARPGAPPAASSTRGAKRTGPRRAQRPTTLTAGGSGSAAGRRATNGTTASPVVARRAPPTGPRLMLEPAQALAASDPPPAAAASAPMPSADSAGDVELRVRERERLASLEQSLERMRQQNLDAQQSLATLQARLLESQASRGDSPVVYGLLALVALLLLAITALLWRQWRMRRDPAWWGSALAEPDRGPTQSEFERSEQEWERDRTATQMRVVPAPVSVIEHAQPPPAEKKPGADMTPVVAEVAVPRELSVEELIDLEQQADFFVVLGQDEAAIDLLMGHVRSSGGASPMPYLKLLEIYRRRAEREAYERIRERFNRRFNAYAPGWEVDPRDGRALETYPAVLIRLQVAWPKPSKAMELLESLLFRRDSSDGTFDLPAYGELLFLYALARDLAEHDTEHGAVDLLLPLVSSADEDLGATRPVPLHPGIQVPSASVDLHLELDFDPPAPEAKP
jgi:pilus assembly protein FimV